MAEKPSDDQSKNYYHILGVKSTATDKEIQQAYKEKARIYHPDKNPDGSEELMQTLNQAKEVLTDKIRRRDYDEKRDDSDDVDTSKLLRVLQGTKISESFEKDFNNWLKAPVRPLPLPNQYLITMVAAFVKTHPRYFKELKQALKENGNLIYSSRGNAVIEHAQKHLQSGFSSPTEQLGFSSSLTIIVKDERQSSSRVNMGVSQKAPILDINGLSNAQAMTLLQIFLSPNKLARLNRINIQQCLLNYIPQHTVKPAPEIPNGFFGDDCSKCNRYYFFKSGCYNCGKTFCSDCLTHETKLPRLGMFNHKSICEECYTENAKQDEDDWLAKAKDFLATKTNDDVYAAIGCFTMALHCVKHSSLVGILQKIANISLSSNYPVLAIPFIGSSLKLANSPKEKLQIHSQIASVCIYMAKDKTEDLDSQKIYLELAKQAIDAGMSNTALEMPELGKKNREIQQQILELDSDIKNHCTKWLKETKEMLADAWHKRDWIEMLRNIEEMPEDADIMEGDTGRKLTIEATSEFLRNVEVYFSKLLPRDKYGIQLLRGIHRVRTGSFGEGIADIEAAIWSGIVPDCMVDSGIKAFVDFFEIGQSISSFYVNVSRDLTNYIENSLKSNITTKLPVLLPSNSELDPRSIRPDNWPSLYVTGRNAKPLVKYENAIHKNINTGQFDEHQAGLSYIDLSQTCDHPAEVALCFIHAAMWFYQEMIKDSASALPKTNAIKEMIFTCIGYSFFIAHQHLHPASQLHIHRYALAIAINTAKNAEKVMKANNTELIKALMDSVIYNFRLCPFWKSPFTKPSEAILLHLISGDAHGKYLMHLQRQKILPVQKFELYYQIYENNFRHLSKHDELSTNERLQQSMQEFLSDESLSWKDVANSITSPLTPRDKDGWLIPQTYLGTNLPFSSITGFEFDMKSADIKIFHKKNGTGLFSMSDVNEALLYENSPYFISLDEINGDQKFHPFQKIRHHETNSIKGSRCQYTMLHADYLLKSFSVGMEVSSLPPFNQRPAKSGLIARLPSHLQEILKPVTERGNYSRNSMHRFWIQADEMTYDVEESNDRVTFKLSEPKMVVRTHPLFHGKDGKLEDTQEDMDPNSPEAQFAADLTKHYDEIANYFPIFKRLKELTKLQFLPTAIQNVKKFLEDAANETQKVIESKADKILPKVQQEAREQLTKQAETALEKFKTNLRKAIEEVNSLPFDSHNFVSEKFIEDLLIEKFAESIKAQSGTYKSKETIIESLRKFIENPERLSSLRPLTLPAWKPQPYLGFIPHSSDIDCSWSSLSAQLPSSQYRSSHSPSPPRSSSPTIITVKDELIDMMITDEIPTKQDIVKKLSENVKQYEHMSQNFNSKIKTIMQLAASEKRVKTPKECTWVPSAMKVSEDKTTRSICYGGVVLHPAVKMGRVSSRIDRGSYVTLNNTSLRPEGRPYWGTNTYPNYTLSGKLSTMTSSGAATGGGGAGSAGGSSRGGGGGAGAGGGDGGDEKPPGYLLSLPLLTAAFLTPYSNDKNQKSKTLGESLDMMKKWIAECTDRGQKLNDPSSTKRLCSSTGLSFSNQITIKATGEKMTSQQLPADQHDQVKNCVYSITDKKSGEVYIGLTTRKLAKRLKEHCRDPKSSVFKHFTAENGKLRTNDMIVTVLHENSKTTRKELHKIEADWINKRGFPKINKRKAFTQNDIDCRKAEISPEGTATCM